MAQKKKPKLGLMMFFILLLSVVAILFTLQMETDNAVVNLVLKQGDKVYVYSKQGTVTVQNTLSKKESPVVSPFIQIFEEDDVLYIAPDNIWDLANLLCGNFVRHDFKERNQDGYLTSGKSECVSSLMKNQSTGNIGEQVRVNTLKLTHPESNRIFEISWEQNLKTYKFKALKNCKEKSFMVTTSPYPGKTTLSSKEFIMVDLEDLQKFYNPAIKLELDAENQLLYLITD